MQEPEPVEAYLVDEPFGHLLEEQGSWFYVRGDTLTAPIYLRLVNTKGGGLAFGGLLVGGPVSEESALREVYRPQGVIDRDVLRSVRVGPLLEGIWRQIEVSPEGIADPLRRALHLHLVRNLAGDDVDAAHSPDKRRIPLPELERFAETYRRAVSVRPSRAISTAAREFGNMPVATAHRWLSKCRAVGLLPPKGQDAELIESIPTTDRGDPLPEEDAARIARAWRDGIRRGNPAPDRHIAERWGVPVGTASRWLWELAQRGALRPGRPAGLPVTIARRYIEELREQGRLPAPEDHPETGEDVDDPST